MSQSLQDQQLVSLLLMCCTGIELGLIPASIADLKKKNFWKWWLFGALLFSIALPAAILAKVEADPVQASPTTEIQSKTRQGKRPIALTILCIYLLVIMVIDMIQRSSIPNAARSAIQWELFITVIWIMSLFGVWMMRKWGLYLFFYHALFLDAYFLVFKQIYPKLNGFLLTVVFCIVGFLYSKRMK